jgi:hypothetical protein
MAYHHAQRWIGALAIWVLQFGCPQKSSDRADASASATATSSRAEWPRSPEIDEVKNAPYYAAFKAIPWSRALRLIHAHRVLFAEENQAGRVYLVTTNAAGMEDKKYATQRPVGVDLAQLVRDSEKAKPRGSKYYRYRQITWKRAVALIRGEVPGQMVASIFFGHFNRVSLTTSKRVELLAIEPAGDPLAKVLKEVDPDHKKFNYVIE